VSRLFSRIHTLVKREGAEQFLLYSLLSFAASVSLTRLFWEITGYPQLGNSTLHSVHVLWGGLLLFVASLLPLVLTNRWVYPMGGILSGAGVGLFIDEVGKFITQTNDYFYPPAAPIIYAFFLLVVLFYLRVRRPAPQEPRAELYRTIFGDPGGDGSIWPAHGVAHLSTTVPRPNCGRGIPGARRRNKGYATMTDQILKILLIGGSGFVSGTLAQKALAAGHQLWAVTRGQRALADGVKPITVDRSERAAFAEALAAQSTDWDLVVDCIGYSAADAEQDLTLFRERARHFVFISTDFVYDPARRIFPQPEDAAHYLADGYGDKKRQAELVFVEGDAGPMQWTVVRPCHIYGPGSLLGCLPEHGRDPQLIERIRRGDRLRLVGGGHFLQQPIFAADLAETILSCAGNGAAHTGIFNVAGPDIVESRRYYEIIGEILGQTVEIEEIPVEAYRAAHPDRGSFLCHRIYDLGSLAHSGLAVPATPLEAGLRAHVQSLL
jgi:nucleoside-diphosphate-sugar epimerase